MNRFVTVYMDDIVIYSGTTERVMPTETQVVIPVQKGTVMVRPGLPGQPLIYDAGIKRRNKLRPRLHSVGWVHSNATWTCYFGKPVKHIKFHPGCVTKE